jgi:hypothetical protein
MRDASLCGDSVTCIRTATDQYCLANANVDSDFERYVLVHGDATKYFDSHSSFGAGLRGAASEIGRKTDE